MKITRFTLMYIFILLNAPEIFAKNNIVEKGDIPVWDGSIYSRYITKMSDNVTANVGFCDGGRTDNGKIYPYYSGCVGFSFINKQERIKRRGKWHLVKPGFYPVHTKIWLDDQLYLEEINPDRDTGRMIMNLPYAIKKIRLQVSIPMESHIALPCVHQKFRTGIFITIPANQYQILMCKGINLIYLILCT